MAAILQWSDPDYWKLKAKDLLHIKLSDVVLKDSHNRLRNRAKEICEKQKITNKEKAAKKRFEKRNKRNNQCMKDKSKELKKPIDIERILAKKEKSDNAFSVVSKYIDTKLNQTRFSSKTISTIKTKIRECDDLDSLSDELSRKMIQRFCSFNTHSD